MLLQKPFSSFPDQIGSWRGEASKWMQGAEYFPMVDAEIIRTYDSIGRCPVNIYVAYLEKQEQDERLISFRVSSLYNESSSLAIETGIKETIHVTHSFPIIGGIRYEMVFWYVLPSGEYAGRYRTKFQTVVDSLIYRRNNAAVVILSKPAGNFAQGTMQVSEDLLSFLHAASPVLRAYLRI